MAEMGAMDTEHTLSKQTHFQNSIREQNTYKFPQAIQYLYVENYQNIITRNEKLSKNRHPVLKD